MTYFYILGLILLISFIYVKKNHLNIEFKSFTQPGFVRIDSLFGVACYCGKQGTGKTYSAIKFCEEEKNEFNYTIITNVKSYAIKNNAITLDEFIALPRIKKNLISYVYEPSIIKIIEYCSTFKENQDNILIFYDEIFSVLEQKGSLRKEVRSFLSQLRKRHIVFVTTAQEWSEIHISFRRYVRFQISCSMKNIWFTKKALVFTQVNDGDLIKWDETEQDFIAPTIQTNIHKGLTYIINLYDTFETITSNELLNKAQY